MSKVRSPRYPSISLRDAVRLVEAIFNSEHTNTMTSEVAAQHLGYKGLNGASLKILSALKKYGLLEGRADAIKVSRDAVTIIADKDDEDSEERAEALWRVALSNDLFADIHDHYESLPSEANLKSFLMKRGFNADAAQKATHSYRDTIQFVTSEPSGYTTDTSQFEDEDTMPETQSIAAATVSSPKQSRSGMSSQVFKARNGERELFAYDFEPSGSVRVLVNGSVSTTDALSIISALIELKKNEIKQKFEQKTRELDTSSDSGEDLL